MSENLKIKSLTPAIAGWWAKFTDDDESRTVWYSPVAAWAVCEVKHSNQKETYEKILPVLTGEYGMEPLHPDEDNSEVLYLPDSRFVFSGKANSYTWFMVDAKEVTQ